MSSQKKYNKKRIIITVLICLLAFAIIGGTIVVILTVTDPEYKRDKANKKTVATCNGYKIPYEELRFLTHFYMDELSAKYGTGIWDDPATAEQHRAELEERLMENLNYNYMILSACDKLDIDEDDEKAVEYADGMIESMKSEAKAMDMTWETYLEKNHATERYLHFFYKTQYLLTVIHSTMINEGKYTYTMSNSSEFLTYVKDPDKYARTIHVYIENDEGESPEKNQRIAERLSDELRAEKSANVRYAMMKEYIMTYDEALDDMTGYGHHFPKGQMDAVYEDVTFSLDSGEVSEVFEYQNGYMIVMRLDVDFDYVKQTAVLGTLLQNMQYVEMNAYVESFRDECTVVMNDYGKSLDLLNLTVVE